MADTFYSLYVSDTARAHTALTGKMKCVSYETASACVTFKFTERTAPQKTESTVAHTAL